MYLFKNYSEEMEETDKCRLLKLTEELFETAEEDWDKLSKVKV